MTRQLFCVVLFLLFIQSDSIAQFTGQYNPLNITGTSNVFKTEIPLGEPSTVGSNYLSDNWTPGTIVVRDGRVAGEYPIRVEVEHGIVEIMFENKPHTLNLNRLGHVLIKDEALDAFGKLQLGSKFTFDNKHLRGVVLVHELNGKSVKLLHNFYIDFRPSTYNVAMDVGSKDNQKIRKERVFIERAGRITEVKGSNKNITKLFDYDKTKMREVIRSQKLKLSHPKDLWALLVAMEAPPNN